MYIDIYSVTHTVHSLNGSKSHTVRDTHLFLDNIINTKRLNICKSKFIKKSFQVVYNVNFVYEMFTIQTIAELFAVWLCHLNETLNTVE